MDAYIRNFKIEKKETNIIRNIYEYNQLIGKPNKYNED